MREEEEERNCVKFRHHAGVIDPRLITNAALKGVRWEISRCKFILTLTPRHTGADDAFASLKHVYTPCKQSALDTHLHSWCDIDY